MVKLGDEIEANPELYGLRRSGRERKSVSLAEDLDDEVESRPRKSRVAYEEYEDDSMEDDSDENDATFETSARKRAATSSRSSYKSLRILKKTLQSPSERQVPAEVRFSTRNNTTVNYAIEDDENEFLESEDEDDVKDDYYYY